MRITGNFENLSFHDAAIESVTRNRDCLRLEISGVFISRKHPKAKGLDLLIEKGTLTIFGVTDEIALTWLDTKASVEHETPDFPIDEIMHATFNGHTFHFDGFKDTLPWHEWFIKAGDFELDIAVTKAVAQGS